MVVNLLNYLDTLLLDFILLALSISTTDIISGCLIAYDVRVHFSGAQWHSTKRTSYTLG